MVTLQMFTVEDLLIKEPFLLKVVHLRGSFSQTLLETLIVV